MYTAKKTFVPLEQYVHACKHNVYKCTYIFLYLVIAFKQYKFGDDAENERGSIMLCYLSFICSL